ncbi:AzlC family ABC transporter permease [Prosthecomicrobium sp. N25]|uniref:AzlC family ABC transporter permease n=1 Tax=Prosthecomicrobium sp. N25 TaxID=3129254 RepID=UPI003076EF12
MDGREDQDDVPGHRWFFRGMRQIVSIPATILMAAFVGFAGLARESGVGLWEAILLAGGIWALPSAVVLVGAVQTNASLAATFIAVSLSSFRLMPMTVALVPVMRNERTGRLTLLFLSHFVAVTAWVFGMTRLPDLPRSARTAYFAGFAITLACAAMATTAVSHVAAARLPVVLAAALTLLTPLYFLVSLWGAARVSTDRLALLTGVAVWPVFHWLEPEFELIWTGLAGGTLAYGAGRLAAARQARRRTAEEASA